MSKFLLSPLTKGEKSGMQSYSFFLKQNTDKAAAKNCVLVWWGDSSLPQLKGYLIQSRAECPDLFLAS